MNEILENIDEGVHFVNKDGKTIIYNNSVQKMEKMNRHDILTNSFFVYSQQNENKQEYTIRSFGKKGSYQRQYSEISG